MKISVSVSSENNDSLSLDGPLLSHFNLGLGIKAWSLSAYVRKYIRQVKDITLWGMLVICTNSSYSNSSTI